MQWRVWEIGFLTASTMVMPLCSGQVANRVPVRSDPPKSEHIPRLPSTAVYKITQVQADANGNTVTHESSEIFAYSRRWQMMSSTPVPHSGDGPVETHVAVRDREAHTISRWTVPGHDVAVIDLPPKGSEASTCIENFNLGDPVEMPDAMKMPRGGSKPVTQNLGTDTILGLEVRGSRTTFTTPAGTIGNSEAMVRTQELWMPTKPGVVAIARTVIDDPWSGKTTRELVDLDLNEPQTSVFQPPPGYEIVKGELPPCPPHSVPGRAPER
jgi:hypothetical protein